MKKIFLLVAALVLTFACTRAPFVETKAQEQAEPPKTETKIEDKAEAKIDDELASLLEGAMEQLKKRHEENSKNPIYESSLPYLKNPVPVADSVATTEAEMKLYIERIPGTEIDFKMIPIKGGKLMMGSPATEKGRNANEGPQVEVEVQPFWMEEHETTWLEFEQFALRYLRQNRKPSDNLSANERIADAIAAPTNLWPSSEAHKNHGKPGYPASGMTLYAAQAYCKWLTTITGRYYRLPTEAEWEYACRAGSTTAYSWGDDEDKLDEYGVWYFSNQIDEGTVLKIKSKKSNAWGLYDMHGNVAEWVLEQYAVDTYANRKPGTLAATPVKVPVTRVDDGDYNYARHGHVARGGSCDNDEPADFRSARRLCSERSWLNQDPQVPRSVWWLTDAGFIGFRVVRPLEPPKTEEEAKLYEPDPRKWEAYHLQNGR